MLTKNGRNNNKATSGIEKRFKNLFISLFNLSISGRVSILCEPHYHSSARRENMFFFSLIFFTRAMDLARNDGMHMVNAMEGRR